MVYALIFLIITLLLIDNPFTKQLIINSKIKYIKLVIIMLGLVHLFAITYEDSSKVISGIFFIGMVLIYSSANKHKGIEDRVARLIFKKIAWILIWLLLLIHVVY